MIRGRTFIGTLPNGVHVFNITKVSMLSLSKEEPKDLDIEVIYRQQMFEPFLKMIL